MPKEKELLHEAIFNYVLTVEEYVFALSEGKTPENCKRARKSARNYANDFFFHISVFGANRWEDIFILGFQFYFPAAMFKTINSHLNSERLSLLFT